MHTIKAVISCTVLAIAKWNLPSPAPAMLCRLSWDIRCVCVCVCVCACVHACVWRAGSKTEARVDYLYNT